MSFFGYGLTLSSVLLSYRCIFELGPFGEVRVGGVNIVGISAPPSLA